MKKIRVLNAIKEIRKKRSRFKISGTKEMPRLSVFRSNQWSYAQLIDDAEGKTLASASTREIKKTAGDKNPKISSAKALGGLIAKKAEEKGIKQAVFDRGENKYHGRVKAVAEGAREAGLKI